jgi:NifU-like protein
MAKSDLFGDALWDQYSNKVSERMNNPIYQGEISPEEAKEMGGKLIIADFGAESCGDAVRLYWVVDEVTNKIIDAKFKSFGCGTAIASSDMMVELCLGKTVDEAVKITNLDVEKALRDDPETPAVPNQKMHCSVMAYDVIKKAASIYKNVDVDSFEDDIIVCECARVSLSTVKEVIRINDLKTVEEITDYTKAGAFCKSCIREGGHEKKDIYLVDILKEVRAEMEKEQIQEASITDNFTKMTLVQKLTKINQVIDENIRQYLVADGGNLEVIDIRDNDEFIDVYIRYMGACSTCASSTTGTLYAIETTLKENLAENIRVLPI